FSNPGTEGLAVPQASAQPQAMPTPQAESAAAGLAMENLPDSYPLTNRPEIDDAIRAEGFEPQQVWDRVLQKNRNRLAKGKGKRPTTRDFGGSLAGGAKDMASQRRRKEAEADPGALARFRASRGPAWKPN